MKKILICLLFSISMTIHAQDQLFKKDNSKVDVKILEITPTEIKYKLFTYQDGPTITISKKEIALIIYQNGVHEVITTTPETPAETPFVVYNSYPAPVRINRDSIEKAKTAELLSTKNLVSFNMLEPINGSIGVNYIREFANNYFNVYVPITVGFAAPYFTQSVNTLFTGNYSAYYSYSNSDFTITDYRYTNKTYEVGLGIHFQTSGKRAVTHFVGPYIGTSQFTGTYTKSQTTYDPNGYSYYNVTSSNKFTMDRLYVMLNNGLLFRVTKNFNIMLMAGLGYHIDTYKSSDDLTKAYNYNRSALPLNAFKGGVSFGYRF
ncbi:MAG: hypothetical protein V4580_10395 [Bacteroidota bacterium]